jgi:hypothetical protein
MDAGEEPAALDPLVLGGEEDPPPVEQLLIVAANATATPTRFTFADTRTPDLLSAAASLLQHPCTTLR